MVAEPDGRDVTGRRDGQYGSVSVDGDTLPKRGGYSNAQAKSPGHHTEHEPEGGSPGRELSAGCRVGSEPTRCHQERSDGMVRIILKEIDAYGLEGGRPASIRWLTINVESAQLEAALTPDRPSLSREICGGELLDARAVDRERVGQGAEPHKWKAMI